MKCKRTLFWVGSMITFALFSNTVLALPGGNDIVICAVQTTGANEAAGQEFIALCNPTDSYISLTDWSIEYYSAARSTFDTPSANILLAGSIAPHSTYAVGTASYVAEPVMKVYNAALAKEGGHLRLVSKPAGQLLLHDTLGYGTAKLPEGLAATAPAAGERLVRMSPSAGVWQDTDNNAADFAIAGQKVVTNSIVSSSNPTTIAQTPATEASEPLSPIITELMPNPASPLRDSTDEFIELYNPHDSPIVLDGMILRVGSSKITKYTIKSTTIKAHEYLAIYSKTTNLALSNSGSMVALITRAGTVVSETAPYDVAESGMSWSFVDKEWRWTGSPTPGNPNIMTNTESEQEIAPKTAVLAKNINVASDKPAKKSRTSDSTKQSAASENKVVQQQGQSSTPTPLHPSIIAGVGLLALVYAGYEYREDIANQFRRLRSNRANRRAYRQKS